MRKAVSILLLCSMLLALSACGTGGVEESAGGGLAASVRDITAALPDSAEVLEPIGVYRADISSAETAINEWLDNLGFDVAETNSESVKERKLRMIVDGQEISITLYDTPAANALYDMLPLDLNFEDFNGIEK